MVQQEIQRLKLAALVQQENTATLCRFHLLGGSLTRSLNEFVKTHCLNELHNVSLPASRASLEKARHISSQVSQFAPVAAQISGLVAPVKTVFTSSASFLSLTEDKT